MKRAFVTGGSGFVGKRLIGALVAKGVEVRALVRSDRSAKIVRDLGAEPVQGELGMPGDTEAMTAGMAGCDAVIHAAAAVDEHGPWEMFQRSTVDGTAHALAAAKAAGVKRFVHIGTEAVLADGSPIVRADETVPLPPNPAGPYPKSKGMAERAVIAANGSGLETVVVRPRFIWGKGDTSLVPKIAAAVQHGKFAWIGGGRYLTSTCHVANVVEGALLAAERGKPGEIYFLTDGEPVEFRSFLSDLLATMGVTIGNRSVPRWAASLTARLTSWMKVPPVTRTAVALIGHEVTVVDAKARRELGYLGSVTREAGLAEMRSA